jgi:nucleotide-binding universal stress UspA family protein
VLVGYDGSPEAQAAPETARELLGSRLRRLTVATVVPHDCAKKVERVAKSELRRVTGALEGVKTSTELLHGRPAVVLGEHAAAGGYDLVVVGPRGAGLSTSVLGSTATELARRSRVPVLLVGAGAPREEISSEPA